ncbi:MAG: hypothetical protein QY307_10850 [Acidimicrobiia bacterium]|nr:MAG: hypothetical protein QY307_10850 [Acidimicrobiia bacterium]
MSDELELDQQESMPVPPTSGELLELVDELIIAVEGARTVPLSGNVMLDRDRLLDMLYRLRDELPEEMRAARWMVRERESFVARTNEKAREMLERARERSEELISESYIVKEAVDEANALVRRAEGESTRIRLEAEDYSEQAFEQTESVLSDLLGQVRRFRAELHQARREGD